jgi:hypothetical protein
LSIYERNHCSYWLWRRNYCGVGEFSCWPMVSYCTNLYHICNHGLCEMRKHDNRMCEHRRERDYCTNCVRDLSNPHRCTSQHEHHQQHLSNRLRRGRRKHRCANGNTVPGWFNASVQRKRRGVDEYIADVCPNWSCTKHPDALPV